MRIAVTYENGEVFQHFGHTEYFRIYDTENNKITGTLLLPTSGSGHAKLAGLLRQSGVEALICGGIGMGAINALKEQGIRLYPGVSGGADDAVEALLNGTLTFDPAASCHHHDHEEGHECHHADGCGNNCHN